MRLRKAASTRINATTHYFYEGSLLTVCGLNTDSFTVKSDDEPLTCRECAAVLSKLKREEQAS